MRARCAALVRRRPHAPRRRRHPPRRRSGRLCGRAPPGRSGCAPPSRRGAVGSLGQPRPRLDLRALRGRAREAEEQQQHTSVRAVPRGAAGAQQIPADTRADRASAVTRCGCSPPTAPRVSSGASSSSPTCRKAAGPTSAGAAPAAGRPARARRARRRRRRRRACWPRSAGCSTWRPPGPARRLVVTAVAAPEQDGEQPSRFLLASCGGQARRSRRAPGPAAVADWPGGGCAVPPPTPASPRRCGGGRRRLARLAGRALHGRPVVARPPTPRRWWGLRARSRGGGPVRPPTNRSRVRQSLSVGCSNARSGGSSTREAAARVGTLSADWASATCSRAGATMWPRATGARGVALRAARRGLGAPAVRQPVDRRPRARRRIAPRSSACSPGTRRDRAATSWPPRSIRRDRAARDGEPVGCFGRVDRLEQDGDGAPSSSTSRPASAPPLVRRCRQPAARPLPAGGRPGCVRRVGPGDSARSGGAELVQLRVGPTERRCQGSGAAARNSPTTAGRTARSSAADLGRRDAPGERFDAMPGEHCTLLRLPVDVSGPDPRRRRCSRDAGHRDSRRLGVVACGFPFSDQQSAAITAPMEPGLVVAGAGTGKTTVMAARVVWLVATGQVPADRVLGPDLHHEGGRRARAPGPRLPRSAPGCWPSRRRGPQPRRRGGGADRARPTRPTPPGCSPSTACGSATSPTRG